MGGQLGGLRVDPTSASDLPAALQAMTRITMVMHHFALENTDTATDPFTVWTYATLHAQVGAEEAIGASFASTALTDAWCVNGHYQPKHAMAPGEWQIFDIVNAGGDRILELEITSTLQTDDVGSDVTAVSTATTSGACSSVLLALDGVYLDTARSSSYVDHLVLVQAQRASLAVKCDSAGTYYLQSAYSSGVMNYEAASVQNLVTLVVSGTAVSIRIRTLAGPWPSPKPTRRPCAPLDPGEHGRAADRPHEHPEGVVFEGPHGHVLGRQLVDRRRADRRRHGVRHVLARHRGRLLDGRLRPR